MRVRLPGPHSSAWVLAEAAVSAILSLGSMLLIGRIIGPEAAGLGMVAISAYLLLDLLTISLFTEALVQRPSVAPRHADSAATAAVLAGAACGVVLAAAGPFLGGGGEGGVDPALVAPLALALAPLLPLSAFSQVAVGLLLRGQRYRLLAMRVLVGQPLALGAGVAAAQAGAGAWAMVALQAVATVFAFLLVVFLGRLRLRPRLDLGALRDLLPVAGPQWLATVVEVGKYRTFVVALGATVAGAVVAQSHFAFRILDAAMIPVWQTMSRLALPRLSALQDDREALAEAYGELAQLQALLGLPVAVGIALTAPSLVAALLGSAWAGTGEAARVAALASAAFFLLGAYNPLFVAVRRAQLNLGIAVASFALQIAALLIVQPRSAGEVAWAWAMPAFVLPPVLAWMVLREIRRSLPWLVARLGPALAATGAMAAAVLLLQRGAELAPLANLLASASVGGAVFLAVAWLALGRRLPPALAWRGPAIAAPAEGSAAPARAPAE